MRTADRWPSGVPDAVDAFGDDCSTSNGTCVKDYVTDLAIGHVLAALAGRITEA